MAKALFEKRQFDNKATGEIIPYDSYSIVGIDVNGDRVELPLKSLNAAEKISFKMVAAMDDPIVESFASTARKATAEEQQAFKETNNKTILDDEDDNDDGKIFD